MFANRRTTPRFNLNIPIRIRRIDQLGSIERTVLSSNVSAGGVYFASELQLEPGIPVRMYFTVPTPIFGMPAARWCCEGRVVYTLFIDRQAYWRASGISFQAHALLSGARLESIEQPYSSVPEWSRRGPFLAGIRDRLTRA
jgi:hypothetical protein